MTRLSVDGSSAASMRSRVSQVHRMFSAIAGRYDFLNTVLSFGRDRHWRTFTTATLDLQGQELVLDVATGTGKLAQELAGRLKDGGKVVGIDFCQEMLRRARHQSSDIELVLGAADNSPFRENTFDCATIAFALRNVPDIETTLREMARVVKEGGKIVSLEFSRPQHRLLRVVHRLYLAALLPLIGLTLSGNRKAYTYLGRSILEFCQPAQLKQTMERAGLTNVRYQSLTWGVVAVHVGHIRRCQPTLLPPN